MNTGNYYGIDFGTTNTSVCLYKYERGMRPIIRNYGTDGENLYPFSSCIAVSLKNEKDYKFGLEVKKHMGDFSEDLKIVTSIKSMLGTKEQLYVNGEIYDGKKLAFLFLNHVKDTVEKAGGDLSKAVFSIPVDFSPEARTDLQEAANEAGIEVRGFVSESSAAYISKIRDENTRAFSKVLVIDFGGGTLDLSVLSIRENKVYEDAVYGIKFGGDDIDKELANRLFSKVYPDNSFENFDARKKGRFLNKIEQMKIEFSDSDEDYVLTGVSGAKPYPVSYDWFCKVITPLIKDRVPDAIATVMRKANIGKENIDAVILAGGSSGLRPFENLIMSAFGDTKIIFDDENDAYQWIVAKGAAVTSAVNCDYRLSDDLCVLMSDDTVYPILQKDTKVGEKFTVISFSTTDDSADAHFIFTDSTGRNTYGIMSVKAKGWIDELFTLTAEIGNDQIARVKITSSSFNGECTRKDFNKLRFYYDLKDVEDSEG